MRYALALKGRNEFRRRRAGGFTLIELVVTLAVLAIIAVMAAPSFTSLVNSNRLTSQANEVVAGLQSARMEAIRRNAPAYMCASANGASCSNASPWAGWIVYADVDRDGVVDNGELLRSGTVKAPLTLRVNNAIKNNQVNFRPDGMAREGGILLDALVRVCIPTAQPAENARDISIASGSRILVDKTTLNGACPAP